MTGRLAGLMCSHRPCCLIGGVMEKMFIVTAVTGEYTDKCSYNLFVCASKEYADICLHAIDNWFQLHGHDRTAGTYADRHHYMPTDFSKSGVNTGRRECVEAFQKQFGVHISIDYTGVEFDIEEIKVFHVQQGT